MLQKINDADTKKQIIRRLRNVLRLDDTDTGYVDELNTIAAQCSIETFNAGSVLILENDHSHCMYIILSGRVDILKGYATPDEVVIATRGVGEIIGVMGIDNMSPRFASVVAVEQVETVVIPYKALNDSFIKWRFVWIANNKLREAQERRYAELVRYKRELGGLASLQEAFLGVVRHEMMTPVAKAIMALGILKGADITTGSREFGDILNIIEIGLYDTQRMVETMLDYVTAHEIGNKYYRRTGFNTLINTAVERLQSFSRVKQINIELFPAVEALWVRGDGTAIVRAAEHMLHNAVKATPNHGIVQVQVWLEDNKAWFSVRDEGPGIPNDNITGIWHAFKQNADVLKRGIENGLGLGLAITKKIVENHSGAVFVESTEGQGCVFGFWLPVDKQEGLNDAD